MKYYGVILGLIFLSACTSKNVSERVPQQVGTGGVGSLSTGNLTAGKLYPDILDPERSEAMYKCKINIRPRPIRGDDIVPDVYTLSKRVGRVLKREHGLEVVEDEKEANIGIILGYTSEVKDYKYDDGPYGTKSDFNIIDKVSLSFYRDGKSIARKIYPSFDPKKIAQEIVNVTNCK